MKLSHELGKIFESEIQAIFEKEQNNPAYLPQELYPDAESRAEAILIAAIDNTKKVLALAIATHRIEEHDDKKFQDESDNLKNELSPEEIEVGTRGWWGH